MNLIKPKKIEKGAKIAFFTGCGPIYEYERIDRAKALFEELGYIVEVTTTTYTQKDFLAADDSVRLATLHELFEDDTVDAILCTRGGYGAIRLLKELDYNIILKNPKFFGGFSDVTAYLCAITVNAHLKTFHSPMPYPDFGGECVSELSLNSLLSAFNGDKFETDLDGTVYREGEAQGLLWGGNLATLSSMVGTKFVPSEPFVLFLEDVNEPAYKIDRYLTQLRFVKEFEKNLVGIVLGAFTELDNQEYFDNIFKNLAEELNIPICSGLKIGHVEGKITVPIGINVKLDTSTKKLIEQV